MRGGLGRVNPAMPAMQGSGVSAKSCSFINVLI